MALNGQQIEPVNLKRKTFRTFIITFWGTVSPTIIAFFILLFFKKSSLIIELGDKGDFYLYSAGLFTSALYLLNENKDDLKELDKDLLIYTSWMITITAALYGVLFSITNIFDQKILSINNISISLNFIRVSSFILFFTSIFAVYRAIYIETKKYSRLVDVESISRQGVDNILNQLPD